MKDLLGEIKYDSDSELDSLDDSWLQKEPDFDDDDLQFNIDIN